MNSAILIRTRSELRARRAAAVGLVLLSGVLAGAVMTAFAGARRTDSAYGRFVRSHLGADMIAFPQFSPDFAFIPFEKLAARPEVVASAHERFLSADGGFQVVVADPAAGAINLPKMLSGRMPRPEATDEAAVSFVLAAKRHVRVGSTLMLHIKRSPQDPSSRAVRFRVVGVEASPNEFPPQVGGIGEGDVTQVVHLSAAAPRSLGLETFDFLFLRFRHGAHDEAAVIDAINKLAGGKPALEVATRHQYANVQRSIHLQAIALRVVGTLIALIGLLVLSQLIARQVAIESNDAPALLALGMTRAQVWTTTLLRAGAVGTGAALLGVAIAWIASPVSPIGVARVAEPAPGFAFDGIVTVAGVLATIALVLGLTAWPAWRAARTKGEAPLPSGRLSFASRATANPAVPFAVAAGFRFALEPGAGRTRVPVRSSMLSVTLAIVGLSAALTFGASLNHLLDTPKLYGWNWSVQVSSNTEIADVTPYHQKLSADPNVADIAYIDTPPLKLGDLRFDSFCLQDVKGHIEPIIVEGRAPRGAEDIALGAKTMRDAHAHIGSIVKLSIPAFDPAPEAAYRVVGEAVIPPNSDTSHLGEGAMLTIDGSARMIPPSIKRPAITDAVVRFAPGVDARQASKDLERLLDGKYAIVPAERPTDLVNFGNVQNLPLVLAGLVALLAAATLAHTLVTAIRRRRRDLAILKMLGLLPRQVRTVVAWQATTFAATTLVIGLPVGAGAGRAIWSYFASQLGAAPEPVTPYLPLLLTIPGAILLANLLAIGPAIVASRLRPAPVLRAE